MKEKEKQDFPAELVITISEGIIGTTAPDLLELTNEFSNGRTGRFQALMEGQRNWANVDSGWFLREGVNAGLTPEASAFLMASLTTALAIDCGRRIGGFIQRAFINKNESRS